MILESIAKLVGACAWPLVALILATVFQKEIRALLGRLRKGAGVEFDPPPQSDPSTTSGLPTSVGIATAAAAATLPFARTLATQGLEATVRALPAVAQAASAQAREEVLVALAARVILVSQFERIEAVIWRSQLALLAHLSAKPAGDLLTMVRSAFYEPAVVEFPAVFHNYPFESYLGFLLRSALVEQRGDVLVLTQLGTEYLAWRIEQRKAPKAQG